VDQHSLKRCALGAADLLVLRGRADVIASQSTDIAVNMPLPPPPIGPRTIIAVDGAIDLPSGNADTDPGVRSTRNAASNHR
jgi:hypothetical protein